MAEMLLINPRKRRATKKRVTRARRRNPMHTMNPKRRTRRKNPMSAMRRRVMHSARRRTRRSNPILGGMGGNYMSMIREALMGGAGAIGIDLVFGQVNKYLPASMQKTAGTIGAGDAIKAIATVFIGHMLNKPTKGFSRKAAMSSLTVQAYEIMKGFVPASMPLGYASPAMITMGTNRVSPIRRGMNAYTATGTPLLSAYERTGGGTPLLSGGNQTQRREGVSMFY